MADFFTDLEAGVLEASIQGAIQKGAQNLANKGAVSQAQVPIITAGLLDFVLGVFKLYKEDGKPT